MILKTLLIKIGADVTGFTIKLKSMTSFVDAIMAEEREKRIWRPLETVIGTKEFLCVA